MENKIIEIVGIIFIGFFVIGMHELGHLITGLVQGFKFHLFVIGPLGIKRKDDKIKVYLNKNLTYYGGVAATLPVDDNPENIKKFAKLILAGPLVSLLLAIICFLFVYLFDTHINKAIFMMGVTSIGIFLATTIPSKTGTFFTDRKRYQRLISKGKEREVEVALLRVMGIYSRDNSYKNVSIDDINLMIEDSNYEYLGLYTKLTYQHEIHGFFDTETRLKLNTLTPKMPKPLVKMVTAELKKLEQVLA